MDKIYNWKNQLCPHCNPGDPFLRSSDWVGSLFELVKVNKKQNILCDNTFDIDSSHIMWSLSSFVISILGLLVGSIAIIYGNKTSGIWWAHPSLLWLIMEGRTVDLSQPVEGSVRRITPHIEQKERTLMAKVYCNEVTARYQACLDQNDFRYERCHKLELHHYHCIHNAYAVTF
jgi:hypothetical protein